MKTRHWVSLGARLEPAERGNAKAVSVQWHGERLVRCETGLAYFSLLVLLVDATEVENHIRGTVN